MILKVIKPYFEFIDVPDGEAILRGIELIGRVCYKSEDKITPDSARRFVAAIIKNGHESVIEHSSVSVRVVCDRGVSHEIVRHRLASYSQESTRYCNYSNEKYGGDITFIKPCFWDEGSAEYAEWELSCKAAEDAYNRLTALGAKPEEARSVLPNSLKTEIVMTLNLRAWRHFFKLRTSAGAHPQMREITGMMLEAMKSRIPVVFDDL